MPSEEPKRKYEPREERLLAEFLARFYPHTEVMLRVRLGTPALHSEATSLEPGDLAILKNFARWADALIITPTGVTIVEAEIIPSPGILSTLELYRTLFQRDPAYGYLRDRPLSSLLIWGFDDPMIRSLAQRHGHEVRIFSPPWLAEALRARFPTRPNLRTPSHELKELK